MSRETLNTALAADEIARLREQNKALVEALKPFAAFAAVLLPSDNHKGATLYARDTGDGKVKLTARAILEAQAAIAQAEARGGSRADGPLLREEK